MRSPLEGPELSEMRPTAEDKAALRLLLDDESLSDWEAEFVESLQNWRGKWTEKQAVVFDGLWEKHYG